VIKDLGDIVEEKLELTLFKIISEAGTARSFYIEAVSLVKEGKIEEAKEHINEGDSFIYSAKQTHLQLLAKETGGEKIPFSLLLLHAEDMQMSAEDMRIMAVEIIDIYEKQLELSRIISKLK